MRIIAGRWRGRPLTAPKGDATRPTADRTRETLFSMLASRLGSFEALSVLDLFAGSGALGLEALSRGAARAVLVEEDRSAIAAIRANMTALDASGAELRAGSVFALSQASTAFDLVLLDPPYGSGAGAVAIDRLARLGWIAPSAWIALETGVDENFAVRGATQLTQRKVGKAMLHLFRLDSV